MSQSRLPGPLCTLLHEIHIDVGTLCRQPSPVPGPLGISKQVAKSRRVLHGSIGQSIDYGDHIVATNADLDKDKGGAVGREDILSTLNGKHECVALLQAYGAGQTRSWAAGKKLYMGILLEQNTMVATFIQDAKGNLIYTGHAALFDAASGGYEKKGINVIHQYARGITPNIVHRAVIKKDLEKYYVVQKK